MQTATVLPVITSKNRVAAFTTGGTAGLCMLANGTCG